VQVLPLGLKFLTFGCAGLMEMKSIAAIAKGCPLLEE